MFIFDWQLMGHPIYPVEKFASQAGKLKLCSSGTATDVYRDWVFLSSEVGLGLMFISRASVGESGILIQGLSCMDHPGAFSACPRAYAMGLQSAVVLALPLLLPVFKRPFTFSPRQATSTDSHCHRGRSLPRSHCHGRNAFPTSAL